MFVNPNTMLFEGLKTETAEELFSLCESIVMKGKVPPPGENAAFEMWMETCNMDQRQRLLTMSTVFPQRVLLSLTRYYRSIFLKL